MDKSKNQEKNVAKELNAKTVVASGALWGAKGDVRNDKFLVECKITKRGYYVFKLETWEKIKNEAIKDGLRIPVMCIDLYDGKKRYAVLEGNFSYRVNLGVRWTRNKSFHIKEEEEVILCGRDFLVIEWKKFLELIESGEI